MPYIGRLQIPYCECILVLLASLVLPSVNMAQSALTKDVIVDRLSYSEQLVRSMHCKFTIETFPTTPEMINHITSYLKAKGKKENEIKGFIVNSEFSSRNSFSVEWWRKGLSERREYSEKGKAEQVNSISFDGLVYRSIQRTDGVSLGHIATKERASWDVKNDIVPYSFLFQFQNEYYSNLLNGSSDYTITPTDNGGTLVHFRHPRIDFVWFKLFFDNSGLLKERHMIRKHQDDPEKRVYEIHKIVKYTYIDTGNGQRFAFPQDLFYSYLVGTNSLGLNLTYMTQKISLNSVDVNNDIPDSTFAIQFPNNIKIYDELTDKGWLMPGMPLPEFQSIPGSGGIRYVVISIIIASVMLVILYYLRKKYILS